MNLALVISSLAPGGAENVLARIASGLAGRGHDVRVVTLLQGEPALPLHPAVRRIRLELGGASAGPLQALAANARRALALRRTFLAEPTDAVLSFMDTTNILVLLALLGADIPVVASERTNPAQHRIGACWRALRRLTYPLAARVTAQTPAACRCLPGRCLSLPNPVQPPVDGPVPEELAPGRLLLAMGRLSPEKGHDMLLRAFARIAPAHPDWNLAILGEGPERSALEALRRDLGLDGRVLLPGRMQAPGGILRRADLFALSSRYEGFPNALAEALACGLPAVAFDCASGPGEIIRHEVDGLLVPPADEKALARSLARLMADEGLRRAMAERAPEISERYGPERVLGLWEDLLACVAVEAGKTGRGGGGPCAA